MSIVNAPSGALRGIATGAVTAFLGIPYATAGRFAAPEPTAWSGIGDATRRGPAAPQPPSRLEHVMGPGTDLAQDEDCLSLNVWTPGGTGLPVLVWLHGGGFSTGSGAEAWYDGALLAERGPMVVVTLNYRLGALGYLYLSQYFAPANLGLLDQMAALRWVRENIAAFGGDPARVTVAGQSAGAQSALAILAHPAGHDLFQQVILESAPTGMRPYEPAEAAAIGELYLEAAGLDRVHQERLRSCAVPGLLAAQLDVARRTRRPLDLSPPFQLVAADGLPDDLLVPPGMPMLIGTTRDEMRAFAADAPDEATDRWFRTCALDLAGAARTAYVYQFDWHPQGSALGACHCIELPFVFGGLAAWERAPMLAGAAPESLNRLVAEVQRAWIGFVHTGSPGWSPHPHVTHFTGD
ncbi:carboxylesterase/lipase family protein [Nonomuraea jiangxiensis]|uniref:Carboxylic ester hydrolase n=1 Tax=Nonomuraea jiangxiensis TaxID=633440 RepID=A0A1G8DPM3_9ACTN|nr:carboxylesterase family protein [Nonomuraea jiangxiensis]SDH59340.1 para-nitrobenzyl esterase [Nonomuraea jiangxiensis]